MGDAAADRLGDEERRVVTVLFSDIVGFTTLSEGRDPEQVKRVIDAAFTDLLAVIDEHGGVVDKVLGDAIVALFGAPIAHEDDPDRAVRAALGMQDALRTFRDEHPGDAVRMRIGVNTGEVLVGTVAGTDYTATGDVVNTAARLQEVAPAGAVYVGDATRQMCSQAVRFRPIEQPVQLRGRLSETTVWQAVAVDTALPRRRWHSDVPFVGRTTELGVLHAACSIVGSGRGGLVAVTGEAGIGKSRLVSEVVTGVVDEHRGALLVEGACAPYGESNVWWPVIGGLFTALGLDRDVPVDDARERVIRRLMPFDELDPGTPEFDRLVELVLHLLGRPSAFDTLGPVATRDAVFAGIVAALRRRSQVGPVILWVDDLQWAAPLLVELIESAARQLASDPVLIITTYRTGDQRRDDLLADWPPPVEPAITLHLSLEPLSARDADDLVHVATEGSLADDVVASLTARAGGNPLFLLELARLATSASAGASQELPHSLRALIAARLDELSPSHRAVLDNAAIIGSAGRVASLRDFAAELGQPFDRSEIAALIAAGFLSREGPRWRFRSDVVREVAYQTLTKQARAQRHAGVARFLATHEPWLVDRRAHHAAAAAELAGELGSIVGVEGDISVVAGELLVDAADRWRRQGATQRSRQLSERALALQGLPDDLRRRVLRLLAEALVEGHDLGRARDVLGELADAAEAADDRVARAEAHRLLGAVEQRVGDLVAARREIGRAVAVFRELGDEPHLAEALRARGFAEIFGGSLAEAEWFLGEAETLFDRVGDERGQAWVQQHRAWVSFLAGDHRVSQDRLATAIAAFERVGDRVGHAWSRGLLAYVHHFGRRDDEALVLARAVDDEARQWGDEWGASMMLELQASIRLWAGEPDEARALAEASLSGFRRIDDRFGMIQALGTLARALVALGRPADADRTVEEVLALSDAFGALAYPVLAAAGTAMHRGRGERAIELADEAIARLDTTGANIDEARVVSAFGSLLVGDADAALARLVELEVDPSPFALSTRALARAMIGDRAAALADAEAVEAMASESSVSYWDLAVARIAALAAAGGAPEHRDRLLADLDPVGDVVLSAFAADVIARTTDRSGQPPTDAPPGWAALAAALV